MSEPLDIQAALRRIEAALKTRGALDRIQSDMEILVSQKQALEQENAALRDRILELTEPEYVPTTAGLRAVPDR